MWDYALKDGVPDFMTRPDQYDPAKNGFDTTQLCTGMTNLVFGQIRAYDTKPYTRKSIQSDVCSMWHEGHAEGERCTTSDQFISDHKPITVYLRNHTFSRTVSGSDTQCNACASRPFPQACRAHTLDRRAGEWKLLMKDRTNGEKCTAPDQIKIEQRSISVYLQDYIITKSQDSNFSLCLGCSYVEPPQACPKHSLNRAAGEWKLLGQ